MEQGDQCYEEGKHGYFIGLNATCIPPKLLNCYRMSGPTDYGPDSGGRVKVSM